MKPRRGGGAPASSSASVADALTGAGACGTGTALAGEAGRCAYAERQPLLVISPWAKHDAVDHTLTDQSSVIRFTEDNWGLPRIANSFDASAGPLDGLFDFAAKHGQGNAFGNAPNKDLFLLDPATGQRQ